MTTNSIAGMHALAGIELALANCNLVEPLTKKDLCKLQSDCLEAPWPFKVRVSPIFDPENLSLSQPVTAIRLTAEIVSETEPTELFRIDVAKEELSNAVCGSLSFHEDSIEAAKVLQLAMTVTMKKAEAFAVRFPRHEMLSTPPYYLEHMHHKQE
ncbi:hypothetical protein YA0089_28310 [Pseudomonas viridiflava]|uniref:hypothetical protein n=1 Tax=Pseudomonas viridiflava TaxID=33069 RepID=UPI0018E620E0|nr:hypothetical protein [Pseudomonas viridiflava]MBI6727523.1 hypothetical protein [Pseudomonas viridiflava]